MPLTRINKKDWTDEQWLEFRTTGIGSSDAPVVAGEGKFEDETPYKLWLLKTGQTSPRDLSSLASNPYIKWGKLHEPNVARYFQGEHPTWAVRNTNFIYVNDDYGFPMLANVDRLVRRPGEAPMILEIKTSGIDEDWGEPGTADIPARPYLQIQHQLATLGTRFSHAMCAVLIRGNDYREYVVPRDEEVIEDLVAIERDFWNKVKNNVAPPAMDNGDLLHRWPKTEAKVIDATPEIEKVVARLRRFNAMAKRMETVEPELRATLGNFMEEADTLKVDGDVALTYKTQKQRRLDQKALAADMPLLVEGYKRESTSRVLRLK